MATNKLDRIERDIQKTKTKIVRGGALQAPPAPQPEFEQDEQEDNADEE